MAVPFGQLAQLAKRMAAAASALGNDDARPEPLGPWQLDCFTGAGPSARARAADRLGLLVGGRGPPLRVLGALADWQAVQCHRADRHRSHSHVLHASSPRLQWHMSQWHECIAITVAMQRLDVWNDASGAVSPRHDRAASVTMVPRWSRARRAVDGQVVAMRQFRGGIAAAEFVLLPSPVGAE